MSKKLRLKLVRDEFTTTYTTGRLYVNGRFFCYTLEDTVRKKGVKVYKETAISAQTYEVVVTHSPKFKRLVPLVKDVPMFRGIRIHRGHTAVDTWGCILVAYERKKGTGRIEKNAEKDLTQLILKHGGKATLKIENRYLKRGLLLTAIAGTLAVGYEKLAKRQGWKNWKQIYEHLSRKKF